jgi:hypothetical protein
MGMPQLRICTRRQKPARKLPGLPAPQSIFRGKAGKLLKHAYKKQKTATYQGSLLLFGGNINLRAINHRLKRHINQFSAKPTGVVFIQAQSDLLC